MRGELPNAEKMLFWLQLVLISAEYVKRAFLIFFEVKKVLIVKPVATQALLLSHCFSMQIPLKVEPNEPHHQMQLHEEVEFCLFLEVQSAYLENKLWQRSAI